jgi:hypothetical protein
VQNKEKFIYKELRRNAGAALNEVVHDVTSSVAPLLAVF